MSFRTPGGAQMTSTSRVFNAWSGELFVNRIRWQPAAGAAAASAATGCRRRRPDRWVAAAEAREGSSARHPPLDEPSWPHQRLAHFGGARSLQVDVKRVRAVRAVLRWRRRWRAFFREDGVSCFAGGVVDSEVAVRSSGCVGDVAVRSQWCILWRQWSGARVRSDGRDGMPATRIRSRWLAQWLSDVSRFTSGWLGSRSAASGAKVGTAKPRHAGACACSVGIRAGSHA